MSCEKGDRGFGGLKAVAVAAVAAEYNIKEKSYPNI
jgi:hypothetical protein